MESFKNLHAPFVLQKEPVIDGNLTVITANKTSDNSTRSLSKSRYKYFKKGNQSSSQIKPISKIACWSKLKLDKWKKGMNATQFYNNFHDTAKQLALIDTIYEYNVRMYLYYYLRNVNIHIY